MYSPTSRAIIPVRIRSMGRFTGPNPWKRGALTEWSIEAYRMVQERYAALVEKNPTGSGANWVAPKGEALGIRSEADGSYHMLPVVLAQLWQSNQVKATQLPALIHAIEPEMKRYDYVPFFGAGTSLGLQKWVCGIHGGLGLALLVLYLFLTPPWRDSQQYSIVNQLSPVFLWGGLGFIVIAAIYFLFLSRRRQRFQKRNATVESRLRSMCA